MDDFPFNVCSLSNQQIDRYGRHLILANFGPQKQISLCHARVLVIGAGGLGSPALLYMAAAGVGHIGIVDGDVVEVSNLQRQVIHTTESAGRPKAIVAQEACLAINPTIQVQAYETRLNPGNARDLIAQYDIIVDATDNVPTRYLINDVAMLLNKPLVSGSAIRSEGQLTVYGFEDGPCYRCIFPIPPPPETVTNCSDGGVLGPVPGVIGVLQAIEVIKIATGFGSALSGTLLLYDATSCRFRSVKLRGKNSECSTCSDVAKEFDEKSEQYEFFCIPPPSSGQQSDVSCAQLGKVISKQLDHVIVDVREPVQYDICSLKGSINIPLSQLPKRISEIRELTDKPLYMMCRRGVFSRIAADLLLDENFDNVYNVSGGYEAWKREVDPDFPQY